MEDASALGTDSHQVLSLNTEEDLDQNPPNISRINNEGRNRVAPRLMQMLIAELIGTYFLVFAGCVSIVVNINMERVVTLPGIAIVWGLVLMVMIYSVGHVSGAHFNPAVTIALASCKRFPLKQVPTYISVQILGSILASGTLRLLFRGKENQFAGTLPAGSELQSLLAKSFAGLAIGATLSINVLIAGPISGASVNPARSLGPAIVSSQYKALWIYIVGPTSGAITGAWVYKFISLIEKPLQDITKNGSILRRSARVRSN